VSLDPGTVEVMRGHAEQQAKERELVGPSWPMDPDRVFRMEAGTPLRVDYPGEVLRATVKRLNESAPLPAIRLHDLRHVHATLLLKAGVPVHVVAARLGHRDPSMTLRVYAHVLDDQGTSAAARFAELMGGES